MSEPTLIQTRTTLATDIIMSAGRLRPVSEAGVQAIMMSIEELGQIVTPLVVRQRRNRDGVVHELLDGAHRLEAARRIGMETVPVRVFECGDDQARLLEIDGNLAGAELNPLDTAVFLATRKAVYERLHPETKAGVAGAMHKNCATELSSVASFCAITAEKFGMTERQVRKIVAAGCRLGTDEIAKLRAAPKPVTLKDLQDIARIGPAPQRYAVVDALAEGRAKSASAALKALKQPVEAPRSAADEQLATLLKAWDRASGVARARFLDEVGLRPAEGGAE